MYGLFVNSAIVAIAGFLGCRYPSRVARAIRALAGICLVALVLTLASGFTRYWQQDALATIDLHRWAGHMQVIITWVTVVAGVGASIGKSCATSTLRQLWVIPVLGLLLALTLLESFTGYLNPVEVNDLSSQETAHRFFALHVVFLPCVLTMGLLIGWWLSGRALRRSRTDGSAEPSARAPIETGNPYQSP